MSLSALSNNRLVMPYSYVPTSQLMSLKNMFFCLNPMLPSPYVRMLPCLPNLCH